MDALTIYTAALKKWKYCKARDEKYSEALNKRKPTSVVSSGELDTVRERFGFCSFAGALEPSDSRGRTTQDLSNLDAYSYCEPNLAQEQMKPKKAKQRPKDVPARTLAKPASPPSPQTRPSPTSSQPEPAPAPKARPPAELSPKAQRRPPKKAAAPSQEITIEERKKRRGFVDEDDDDQELNNYKVDLGVGETNYVMCADEFIEAETDRLERSSGKAKTSRLGGVGEFGGGWQRSAKEEPEDVYALAASDDHYRAVDDGNEDEDQDEDEDGDDEGEEAHQIADEGKQEGPQQGTGEEAKDENVGDDDADGMVHSCYLSASSVGIKPLGTWQKGRESAMSADRRSRISLRPFALGGYRQGGAEAEAEPRSSAKNATGSQNGADSGNRRRRGAMSFVGLRQLQEREESKPERSATVVRTIEEPTGIDPYLDFLVTVTTARLANSGSALSKSSSPPSSPSPSALNESASTAHMLSASMPTSALQGPLYSVMRRQQLEVQQTRKRLDAEGAGHGPAMAVSSTSPTSPTTFRTGNPQSTPQGSGESSPAAQGQGIWPHFSHSFAQTCGRWRASSSAASCVRGACSRGKITGPVSPCRCRCSTRFGSSSTKPTSTSPHRPPPRYPLGPVLSLGLPPHPRSRRDFLCGASGRVAHEDSAVEHPPGSRIPHGEQGLGGQARLHPRVHGQQLPLREGDARCAQQEVPTVVDEGRHYEQR